MERIIHYLCYLLALVPAVFVALKVDYRKIFRCKSNFEFYIVAIVIGLAFTFILGEFFYIIATLFI